MRTNRFLEQEVLMIREMHVIDLPIPEDFFTMKELGQRIREAMNGKGKMDNAAQFATKLELKRKKGCSVLIAEFYDDLEAKDSDTEDFTVTCSSYEDDSRSRLFTSNNHCMNARYV